MRRAERGPLKKDTPITVSSKLALIRDLLYDEKCPEIFKSNVGTFGDSARSNT